MPWLLGLLKPHTDAMLPKIPFELSTGQTEHKELHLLALGFR